MNDIVDNICNENPVLLFSEKQKLIISLRAYMRLIPRLFDSGIPYWDKLDDPIQDWRFSFRGGGTERRGGKHAVFEIFLTSLGILAIINEKEIQVSFDEREAWNLMKEADNYNDFLDLEESGFVDICFSHYCLTRYLSSSSSETYKSKEVYNDLIENYLKRAVNGYGVSTYFFRLLEKDVKYIFDNLKDENISKKLLTKKLFWDEDKLLMSMRWIEFKDHILKYDDSFLVWVLLYEALIFGHKEKIEYFLQQLEEIPNELFTDEVEIVNNHIFKR